MDVAVELVFLPSFVQHEPFLQLLSPHDFMHDLVHLLSFEVAAVCCCCPKASPVIPTTAMVKKIFFIIIKVFNGLKCKGKQSFPEELNFYYFCPALVSPNGG